MTGGAWVTIVAMLGALFLAVRSSRAQSTATSHRLIQGLIWLVIIVALAVGIGWFR